MNPDGQVSPFLKAPLPQGPTISSSFSWGRTVPTRDPPGVFVPVVLCPPSRTPIPSQALGGAGLPPSCRLQMPPALSTSPARDWSWR